jgi:hypothetical protein
MKLSNETINVLKNFASINQGIIFKKGKVIKTISSQKTILAEATIGEEIPVDFGVYDLNNFLSVVSLHKDDPSFDFDEKHVVIFGNGGRSKIKYRFCDAKMIVTPPEKNIKMSDPEIVFNLKQTDLDWVLRAASVLGSPQVAVESNGQKISLVTFDTSNDSAHTDALEVADGNGDTYKMIFKTENLKMIPGDYEVSISSTGISNFKNAKVNLQYWIATEQGSNYTKV